MDGQKMISMAEALKSIAHPKRLRLVMILGCNKSMSVTEIQKALGISQSMTSQHLHALKINGIIKSQKNKNKVYYSIKDRNVIKLISCMKNCGGQK